MNLARHHYASPACGLLIDANLLTVVIIGALGQGEVQRFKRTRAFDDQDALAIDTLGQQFGWLGTTPHVVTEASNLIDWLDSPRRDAALIQLARFADTAREIGLPSVEVMATPVFARLGLTDAALCMAAQRQPLALLTVDLALYQYAAQLRLPAINYNHIRQDWLL